MRRQRFALPLRSLVGALCLATIGLPGVLAGCKKPPPSSSASEQASEPADGRSEPKGEIVVETAAVSRSPDGRIEVQLISTSYPDGKALTQVVASHAAGGSGLVAFQAPRVPVAIEWIGNTKLVISYPLDMEPSNTHNNVVAGANVEYKPVPISTIPALKWAAENTHHVAAPEKQVRGDIVAIASDGKTRYRYDFYDTDEKDKHTSALQARGYQGGGETWAGITYGLLKLRAPELLGQVEMDPEGEGLAVWSDSKLALEKVATLIAMAKADDALLDAAIKRASDDGQIE